MNDMNDTVSGSLWRRRTVLGALGAAPVAVGAVLAGLPAALSHALTSAFAPILSCRRTDTDITYTVHPPSQP
jgi:hypothetical protein